MSRKKMVLTVFMPTVIATGILAMIIAPSAPPATSVIVQGKHLKAATASVRRVHGEITHELGIIDAVASKLTAAQINRLRSTDGLQVYENRTVVAASAPEIEALNGPVSSTGHVSGVEATALHAIGIRGTKATVAVIDTGHWTYPEIDAASDGSPRVAAQYDAIRGVPVRLDFTTVDTDGNGHGTMVESVIVSSAVDEHGVFHGVAPDARLVSIQAFDADGRGTYADVIRGIDFVVQMRNALNIRVLNCSFSAEVISHYWDDPLNRALMAAWEAGIVVVASAGDQGFAPMTVGVPGNNPYAITVGAWSNSDSPDDLHDDYLAPFSAAGPTREGFVKPDVVAPGDRLAGLSPVAPQSAYEASDLRGQHDHVVMSGTSQATAVVSGIVALLLDAQPWLTPDDVKCRLIATAAPAVDGKGRLKYSVFQQGAGLVNAADAATSFATSCANSDLAIADDLAGVAHFGGTANLAEDGTYYLMNGSGDGSTWDGSYAPDAAYSWNHAYLWNDGSWWDDAYIWSNGSRWTVASTKVSEIPSLAGRE